MDAATLSTAITLEEMRQLVGGWRENKERVAFVPTMGALHEGHLSLVDEAKNSADRVVVSIFVNPAQFGPQEDFAKYPRTLNDDVDALKSKQVDALYLPNAASIYPEGFATYIETPEMAKVLCGAKRPTHFRGVLTVVLKLFHMVEPDVAVFGKKDYQQLTLIKQMARDLNLRVQIKGGDIIREPDGLAMSSRNRYLTPEQREQAAGLNQSLEMARVAFQNGERDIPALIGLYQQNLEKFPGVVGEYAEIRRQHDLADFGDGKVDANSVFCIAAAVGDTRLIDNVEMDV